MYIINTITLTQFYNIKQFMPTRQYIGLLHIIIDYSPSCIILNMHN